VFSWRRRFGTFFRLIVPEYERICIARSLDTGRPQADGR
jgi:hypothetical protein